jgi:hypothetical protein
MARRPYSENSLPTDGAVDGTVSGARCESARLEVVGASGADSGDVVGSWHATRDVAARSDPSARDLLSICTFRR